MVARDPHMEEAQIPAIAANKAPDLSALGAFEYALTVDVGTGRYTLLAKPARNTHGVAPSGLYDETVFAIENAFIPEEERETYRENARLSTVLRHLAENTRYSFPYRLAVAGTLRLHEASFVYLLPEKSRLFAMIRDIQAEWEAKQLEQRLALQSKQVLSEALSIAKQATNARSVFLANINHEIRSPLHVILGMSKLAISAPENTEQVLRCMENIHTASGCLLKLMDDLLGLTGIKSRDEESTMERFRLHALLEDTALSGHSADKKGLGFTQDFSALPDAEVVADRVAIAKILTNILDNAVACTEPGGSVSLTGAEKFRSGNALVAQFVIADTGTGMSGETLQRIYEPFMRERKPGPDAMTGPGLGMSIAKCFADAIGATISIESTLGSGTSFTVDIPLEVAEDSFAPALEALEASGSGSSRSLAGRRILLAEDSDLSAEIAISLLSLHGMAVEHAQNGREAVDMYEDKPAGYYDAVLMDVQMPVMDGLAATRAIRAKGREDSAAIPIIAMSANVFQEDLTHALRTGMNDYITKPFDLGRLLSSLKTHIAYAAKR